MSKHVVTRESITETLKTRDRNYVSKFIGRALVVLLQHQTESERVSDSTQEHNLVGFTHADAFSGSMTAKYFLKHGKLEPWQMERWMKLNKHGIPRIAKYWRQLDQAAHDKAVKKQRELMLSM